MGQPRTRPAKTLEDYCALPEGVRAELIDGELYVTPAPRPDHQRVAQRLLRVLAPFVERESHGGGHAGGRALGEVFIAPLDVHLPSGDIVQPDLIFVRADQAEIVRADAIHGAPQLLIEVLSSSHAERDRIVKRRLFAENGVSEYWIVDPDSRSIEVLVLSGRSFEPRGWFPQEASILSPTFPGLDLPVAHLFRRR